LCSVGLLGGGVFLFKIDAMWIVWVGYLFGGISIGSFEANMITSVSPLGHATKFWAIVGMPLGFTTILIGGFMLTALGVPPVGIYMGVFAVNLIGAIIFFFFIPVCPIKRNCLTLWDFLRQIREGWNWVPKIWMHSIALMIDMFGVALFTGIMLYIFDASKAPFLPHDRWLIPKDWYFVIYNTFSMLGDASGRKLAYLLSGRAAKIANIPFVFWILTFLGMGFCLSKIGLLGPFGIFCIMHGNGLIYATTTRHIDEHVHPQYNLIALSLWLFVGDIGSFTARTVCRP
jgi:hypothetical protein